MYQYEYALYGAMLHMKHQNKLSKTKYRKCYLVDVKRNTSNIKCFGLYMFYIYRTINIHVNTSMQCIKP